MNPLCIIGVLNKKCAINAMKCTYYASMAQCWQGTTQVFIQKRLKPLRYGERYDELFY